MKKVICLLALVILTSGCAGLTYRTNEKFDTFFTEKKKVAVMKPDMKIFKLTAGGVDQYQDDWSIKSTGFMKEELRKELDTFDTIEFVYVDKNSLDASSNQFINRQKAIYYLVAYSIVAHTYFGRRPDSPAGALSGGGRWRLPFQAILWIWQSG